MNASIAATTLRSAPAPGLVAGIRRMQAMRADTLACTRQMYAQYGAVVGERLGPFRSIHLFGPDAVKRVLLNREGLFSNKRAWDLIIGKIFTNGLMLRDGEDHRLQRRIMHAAFTTPALERYLDVMNGQIAARLDRWAPGPDFSAYAALKRLTLDLACSVFLGIEIGTEAERVNRAFEHAVAASMAMVRVAVPGLAWSNGLAGRANLKDFLRKLIPQKRSGEDSDLFSQLCRATSDEGTHFTDDEIIDHMIFLMMAAHDTTTSTLTSMLYELAKHPAWQERVREEANALGSDVLAYEAIDRLPSVPLVMNETLRRYPPLPSMPRMATRDFEHEGHLISEGTMVAIHPIHTHHMEEWWSRPFDFDPERFGAARAEHKRHSHNFVAFGGGAHMCIGMRFAEIQIPAILYQLVRRFAWTVPDDYLMPVQQSPISKPKDGLPLRLRSLRAA